MGRLATFAFAVCIAAAPVWAQAPATVQRLAEIEVQLVEGQRLWQLGNVSNSERNALRDKLLTERTSLYRQFEPAELRRVKDEAAGIANARLSILRAQWQREDQERRAESERKRAAAVKAIPAAVKAALEPQRRRILLQQRRDRGEVSPEDFAAQDQRALDEIKAVRDAYVAEHGTNLAYSFDSQLAVQTRELVNNPARLQPRTADRVAPPAPPRGSVVARGTNAKPPPRPPFQDIQVPQYRPKPSFDWATGVGATFLLALLGGVVFLAVKFLRREPDALPALSGHYGTAQWAPHAADVSDPECVFNGVFFGKSSKYEWRKAALDHPGVPVCSAPEGHTLIVARTRAGKGARVVIPTLLRYAGSAFVIDPKGENAAVTARTRRDQLGQKVYVINPWNELSKTFAKTGFAAANYNPLDIVDRDDPNAFANALALAAAICPPATDDRDKFWQGNAAGLLTAVFLWLAHQPGEVKTLARARSILTLNQIDLEKNFLIPMSVSKNASKPAYSGAMAELAQPFIGMPAVTYGGIIANVTENTKFLSDPQIKTATATSSFSMNDLITERVTIYLVIPPDRVDTQKVWLRLVLAAAMHSFKRYPVDERPGHRCLFLIDEFGALGNVHGLPNDVATMSGYGVDLALVLQGLDQLKANYGEARGTILSNCAWKWFCAVTDLDTAEWLNKCLGKATVRTTSFSNSAGVGGAGENHSVSYGEMGQELLTVNQIMHLGRDSAIVLQPEGYPLFVRPVDYRDLPSAFGALKTSYPVLYWQPPVQFDPNPYQKTSWFVTTAAP